MGAMPETDYPFSRGNGTRKESLVINNASTHMCIMCNWEIFKVSQSFIRSIFRIVDPRLNLWCRTYGVPRGVVWATINNTQ